MRNRPQNIIEQDAFWGKFNAVARDFVTISYRLHVFRRRSMTAVQYRDKILDSIVRFYAAAIGPAFHIIDNNVHPYRVVLVEDYIKSERIARMEWPVYSPNLNPTENF